MEAKLDEREGGVGRDDGLVERTRTLQCLGEHGLRALHLRRLTQGAAEHRHKREPLGMISRKERDRSSLEQVGRGGRVAACVGTASGRGEARRSPLGEVDGPLVRRPELGEPAVRLLEVVGDDLLELLALPVEPAGEALVEIGAELLGQPRVCRIADERVPEAERIRDCVVRPDQLFAHERGQADAGRPSPVGRQLAQSVPLEVVADDGGTLRTWRSASGSASRRASSSAWIVGGT